MHILLVDDTELFLDLERSFLERESFTISTARSGEEALEAIGRDRHDLIILDLVMPGMDGDAVCAKIKSNPITRSLPIIMVSSGRDEELRNRCIAAGCDAFVPKPLRRDDLLNAIEKVIVIAKRKHPRVPTHLSSYVRHGEDEVDAWIHTISVGGMFIEIDPPPDSGTTMEVTFALPEGDTPVRATVQVRWAGKVRAEGASGVGVQFMEIDDSEREAIGRYVDSQLSRVGSLKGFA